MRARAHKALTILGVVLLVIPAVTLAAISALIIYARTDAGHDRVRRIVLAQAHATLPGLQIGRIRGDYVRNLVVEDVTIRDRQGRPAVHVDRVEARFSLLPLLHRRLFVREVTVQGPRVLGRPTADGSLNLTQLTAPPKKKTTEDRPKSGGSSLAIQVDRLAVTGGSADVETAAGQTVVVQAFDLRGSLAMAGDTVRAALERLAAHAVVQGEPYRVELGARVMASDREIHAVLDRLVVGGAAEAGNIVLSAEAGGPREEIGFQLAIGLPERGTVRAHGQVGLIPGGLGAYAVALRAADVHPRALVATAPAGVLGLNLEARGSGTPLSPGSRAALEVTIPPSRIAGLALREARVEASADGDAWKLARALVRGAGAEVILRGHGWGQRIDAALRATVGDPVDGRLSVVDFWGKGLLMANLRGMLFDDLSFAAAVDGSALAIGSNRIGSAALRAKGTADKAARTMTVAVQAQLSRILAGQARVSGVTMNVNAAGPFRAPHGKVQLAATGVQTGPQGPALDKVLLTLNSDGRNLRLQGGVSGPGGRGGIDAHGVATPREARVTLDRFSVDLHSPRLTQAIALREPVTVRWRADDLVELGDMRFSAKGEKLSGNFKVAGLYRLDRRGRLEPRATLALSLRNAVVGGMDLVDADGWLKLGRKQLQGGLDAKLASARLQLAADLPLLPSRTGSAPKLARNGPLDVQIKTNQIKLQELPVLHKQLARRGLSGGTVSLTASIKGEVSHPDAKVAFDLHDAELRSLSGQGRDSVVRRIPGVGAVINVDTERGRIRTAGQALLYGAGFVKFDSRLETDLGDLLAGGDAMAAPVQIDVEIPKFQISSLKGYFEQLHETEGVLAARVALRGTLRQPKGRADFSISDARVAKLQFGPIEAHGVTDGDKVRADLSVAQKQGGTLLAHADVGRTGGRPLTASVTAKKLDLSFARVFITGVRELAGVVDANLTANGTVARPGLQGAVYYYDGRLGLVGQPTFHDVAVTLTIKPDRVDVQKLHAFSGGGVLTGKGWLTLDGLTPTGLVFTANANRFVVAAAGSTGARLDGDLAVEAALSEAVVSGKVKVPEASLWLPKVGPTGKKLQKIEPHEDVRFVDEAAKAAAEKKKHDEAAADRQPRKLDIKATAGTVYVRGKDLDIELDSNLRVTSNAQGGPTVNGVVQIRRGRINITGQRFDFEPGQISFDGGVIPHLEIRITHQYPEALVSVEIRGTPDRPELRLSSDPPIYDQAQIVSLVLTGQAGGQPSTGGSFDPTAAVATAVLGKLADKIAPELGLDVLRVENVKEQNEEGTATGESETRVEVGKYISERVYLSYAHVFGSDETQNRNEAHVEYRVTRRWLVETVFGDAGVGGVDALWTYRY
jgi:autotransporter translocation and assembly factor TamB